MNQYVRALLKEDMDGDGDIDIDILLAWDPVTDKDSAAIYRSLIQNCIAAIHANDAYADELAVIYKSIIGGLDTPSFADAVAVSGDYAYVADKRYGLQVVDISDPANPVIIGAVDTLGSAFGVAVAGDYDCVANSTLQQTDFAKVFLRGRDYFLDTHVFHSIAKENGIDRIPIVH
jgi:hypothetical protein